MDFMAHKRVYMMNGEGERRARYMEARVNSYRT